MYEYEKEKHTLYSDRGMDMYLEIRDKALSLIKTAGCATLGKNISGSAGDTFMMLACVDRLVEKGILKEVGNTGFAGTEGRIFTEA